MGTLLKKLVAWTVGAVAAVALVGGLTTLTAQPVEAFDCQNDGLTFMGQQPSENACIFACYAVHGESLDHVGWNPSTGCCRCFY
jgi:hypothetical protein